MQKIADRYEIRNVSQVKAWVKKFKEVDQLKPLIAFHLRVLERKV